ncbi:hypothetical protein OG784_11995 [Streptomyces sp. NBC_01617]|uniref:hypothetical protein n=1 Tax=Streptomyces sp. NBC_01617 TaxID=2975899 RepID=UPI00386389B7|nr:hypothetical protein OG784_11995 [Streptomyces sp. NBC_01617]
MGSVLRALIYTLGAFALLAVTFLTPVLAPPGGWDRAFATPVGIAFLIGLLGVMGGIVVWLLSLAMRRSDRRVAERRQRVLAAEEGLERALSGQSFTFGEGLVEPPAANSIEAVRIDSRSHAHSRLGLSELWAVTHRRLDLYHEIATGQASRSFRNAQVAMVFGFALLVAFVLVALQASTTAGAVVAGALGAVAAALAGYVSRTFVRSQEAAASHLRSYFDQPLELSRYLAAERLVADSSLSDEQRAEVVTELAKAMITGPAAPNTGTGTGTEA